MNYCAVSEKQTRDESTYTYGIWNTWKRKKGGRKNELNIDVVSTWPLGLIIPCYLQQLKLFNPFAYSSESSYNYFCYFSVSLALSTYCLHEQFILRILVFYRCDGASPSHMSLISVAPQNIYVHPFGSSTLCSLSDLFALCIWLFLFAIFRILYETPYFAAIFLCIITTIDVVLLFLQLVVFVMKLRTFHYSFACSVWNNNRKNGNR